MAARLQSSPTLKNSFNASRSLVPSLLVLEDEKPLRDELRLVIERKFPHLKVLRADTPGRAMELLDLHGQTNRIELILADIILPGNISGLDFWNICHPIFPSIPFLFMSGLPAEFYHHLEVPSNEPPPRFLAKPFSEVELSRILAELLHASPTLSVQLPTAA